MQTFLPYPNFKESAEVLDYRRLGNQRLEAKGILYLCYKWQGEDYSKELNILNPEYLWKRYANHPAVLMWVNHTFDLALYGHYITIEWIKRGYKDNQLQYFEFAINIEPVLTTFVPDWLGNKKLHDSHKSKLLQKDYTYYKQFNWDVPLDLDYYWPVKKEK